MKRPVKHNRLIDERSPYLLQHAANPVDWWPWCDEAFETARAEDKPVFLSIGYSTCHWCHVMARESFEDREVARLMNDAFVNVKVDREERPDIDGVYTRVCRMMTGRGGWPLTIVMAPDRIPFFAGTYFPKESRFGLPGILELVPELKRLWENERERIIEAGEKLISALALSSAAKPDGRDLTEKTLGLAYEQLSRAFDGTFGGFGNKPKFPTPHNLFFLLRYWKRTGKAAALAMVEKTLTAIRLGGVYDHLGGGFHRYSTDREWLVPHFEKMLYDQALVATAYIEAYQATGKPEYADTTREVFEYVLRDVTSPDGAFYSAEDADSEGVEGKFYVWTEGEVRRALSAEETDLVVKVFGVTAEGNFVDEVTKTGTETNILHLKKPLHGFTDELGLTLSELEERVEGIKRKLYAEREKRVRPHRDGKVLTDWNGLMVAALAKGSRALGEPKYAEAAEKAVRFIFENLRAPEGSLLHAWREGVSAVLGYLDDYAFFTWGLIELYETTFKPQYLRSALELAFDMAGSFRDEKTGGFFFAPDDGETLLTRQMEIFDGAVPSGNSVAMLNLLRLGRLTGCIELEETAAAVGRAFSAEVAKAPANHAMLMAAVDFAVGPSHEVVIVGDPGSDDTRAMLDAVGRVHVPNAVVLLVPVGDDRAEITELAPYAEGFDTVKGKATAYVCSNFACERPTNDIGEMLELLGIEE
ncbi:MAG: thioredoxin domain-containing protein [Candidatus Coatesbacteria bacterium]|nr:MAG: thioredoxin domain-containing protein [Candidatus Coatesbacteria bacterium]